MEELNNPHELIRAPASSNFNGFHKIDHAGKGRVGNLPYHFVIKVLFLVEQKRIYTRFALSFETVNRG